MTSSKDQHILDSGYELKTSKTGYQYEYKLYIDNVDALYRQLDKKIAGNSEAKRKLAVLGYMYYVRATEAMGNNNHNSSLPRFNSFFSGPSGFGKTYFATVLAEVLGLPFIRLDMSSISAAGWKGDSINDVLADTVKKYTAVYNGHVVLFFDEIDKVVCSSKVSESGNDGNVALQANLLDIADGVYTLPGENQESCINNALIIFAGSFQRQRNEKEKQATKKGIGFNTETDKSLKDSFLTEETWRKKLEEYGFMPELLNRIQSFVNIDKLDLQGIRDVLYKNEYSPYKKYLKMFGEYAQLGYIEAEQLVEKAHTSEVGLRELNNGIFKHTQDQFLKELEEKLLTFTEK